MNSNVVQAILSRWNHGGLAGVASAALRHAGPWLAARRELGRGRTFERSEDLLAHTRSLAGGWFSPWQVDSEICALLDRVRQQRPSVVVEIGTANGGTLLLWTRVAAPDALIVSIDLPGGGLGGGYPSWRGDLYRRFCLPGQRLVLLRGDSHDVATRLRLKEALGERAIDFLFIDGDHSYQGVKQDHEDFAPLVRPGGLIALHDIQPIDDGRTEVPRYWREICDQVCGTEAIASPSQSGFGIGWYRR